MSPMIHPVRFRGPARRLTMMFACNKKRCRLAEDSILAPGRRCPPSRWLFTARPPPRGPHSAFQRPRRRPNDDSSSCMQSNKMLGCPKIDRIKNMAGGVHPMEQTVQYLLAWMVAQLSGWSSGHLGMHGITT